MQLEGKHVHAPEIGGVWVNSSPLTMRQLRGSVVLIDFWDYTCVNCIRTLPYVREWDNRYRAHGLVTVGVHAPEFRFARSVENVRRAVEEFAIAYPVVLDNDYTVWQAYANRYWPAKHLVDSEGYIRYFHAGEGQYEETELAIHALLREVHASLELPEPLEPLRPTDRQDVMLACEQPTPELYLGQDRGGAEAELSGPWILRPDCCEVSGAGARLQLDYSAAEVNLVVSGPGTLEVRDNGLPIDHQSRGADLVEAEDGATIVAVEQPRMYSLIRRDRFMDRRLELISSAQGMQLFAFTFGTCLTR